MSDQKQAIRDFVAEISGIDMSTIEDDTPLITGGIIDSMHTLSILTWLEDTTGKRFSAIDLSVDQLDSINAIATFLDKE